MVYGLKFSNSVITGDRLVQELKQLADEIRAELSSIVSRTHKSIKASLAVVELTVALHYVFHAPVDKILWDVGEQVISSRSILSAGMLSQEKETD